MRAAPHVRIGNWRRPPAFAPVILIRPLFIASARTSETGRGFFSQVPPELSVFSFNPMRPHMPHHVWNLRPFHDQIRSGLNAPAEFEIELKVALACLLSAYRGCGRRGCRNIPARFLRPAA